MTLARPFGGEWCGMREGAENLKFFCLFKFMLINRTFFFT